MCFEGAKRAGVDCQVVFIMDLKWGGMGSKTTLRFGGRILARIRNHRDGKVTAAKIKPHLISS